MNAEAVYIIAKELPISERLRLAEMLNKQPKRVTNKRKRIESYKSQILSFKKKAPKKDGIPNKGANV